MCGVVSDAHVCCRLFLVLSFVWLITLPGGVVGFCGVKSGWWWGYFWWVCVLCGACFCVRVVIGLLFCSFGVCSCARLCLLKGVLGVGVCWRV